MTKTKGKGSASGRGSAFNTVNVSSSGWMNRSPKLGSRHGGYGYDFDASMNMRKHARKETRLPGICSPSDLAEFESDNLKGRAAEMIVDNISRSGMAFTLSTPFKTAVGDLLNARFALDTKNRTVVDKKVIVRRVESGIIAGEFRPHIGTRDTALAVYLLP